MKEAVIFAGDLMRMYSKYAESQGFKTEEERCESDHGGYKEIGSKFRHVYSKLKFENGAHRVQRVPETESGGRDRHFKQLQWQFYQKLKM